MTGPRQQANVRVLIATALSALLAACKPAPPPTVDALHFPVVVAWESGIVRHDDAADLRSMSTQRVINAKAPPFLVDSNLDVYRLDKLQSVHGGMWLMANPSGNGEVSFELARIAQGDAAQARTLLAASDWHIREGKDEDARARLAQANTLAEMLAALER